MATVAELLVKISGDSSGLRKELAATKRQLKRAFGAEGLAASSLAAKALGAFAVAAGAAGVASISLAGKMAMTKRSFETLTGSAEKATEMISELKDLDDKSAFDFDTYADASKKLMAMGMAADTVVPILTTIGDASAALGQGQEGIGRITLAFSQMTAKGKVSAQEMNQLAENSVSGWQYLSDATGKSVKEIMKLSEDGAINGAAAVKVILAGMQKDYAGTMEKMENETPIVWSTIVSNTKQILAGVGPAVDKAFGINKTLQRVRDYLVSFKKSIDQIGIRKTFENMIPGSVKIGITTMAGAITALAVPSLLTWAKAAWAAVVANAALLGWGAAIGALAGVIWVAWKPLGDYFKSLWKNIWGNAKYYWYGVQKIIFDVLTASAKVYLWVTKTLGLNTSAMQSVVDSMSKHAQDAATKMNAAWGETQSGFAGMSTATREIGAKIVSTVKSTVKGVKNAMSGTTPEDPTAGLFQAGSGEKEAKKLESLKEKARDLHNSIQEEWAQTTSNDKKQLDLWYQQQKEALDKVKNVSTTYNADMAALDATYNAKDKKITQDKLDRITELKRAAADLIAAYGNAQSGFGLEGAQKELHDLKASYDQETTEMTRKYEDMTVKFSQATEEQKQEMIKAWQDAGLSFQTYADGTVSFNDQANKEKLLSDKKYLADKFKVEQTEAQRLLDLKRTAQDNVTARQYNRGGIGLTGVQKELYDLKADYNEALTKIERDYQDKQTAFKNASDATKKELIANWKEEGLQFSINAQGQVDFAEQAAQDRLDIERKFNADVKELYYERTLFQGQLDKAYNDGNIQRYTELLGKEQALFAQDLVGRQAMIDQYYTYWQETHRTAMSYMAEVMDGMYGGLTDFFADIINGAKSIGDAWQSLKNSILSMLGQMVAKWMASQIMMAVFGKTIQATATGVSAAAAATTAAAWAPAAAMVSLASYGANAVPAMAGIGATYGLSIALAAIPAMAEGGITTGPTLAEIGEGRYREAVLPLNKKAFEKIGLTDNKQNVKAGDQYHVTIQAIDGKSTEYWLENGGGAKMIKFLKGEVKGFASVEV
jgi:tape measure domain-containing protein